MIESGTFRGPDEYAMPTAIRLPVLHFSEGTAYLFCSRACLWMYYASGQRQLKTRANVRWGCWYCSRGIEEDDDAPTHS